MKAIKVLNLGKREKVEVYYDNFEYFQPNKHKCGDCHIRCICAATGMSWLEAFDGLVEHARRKMVPVGSRENITEYLKSLGYSWHGIKPSRGETRPTVAEFARNHENDRYVLNLSSHVVGGSFGVYKDIWDCGYKPLYGYWLKENR